jgi:hypothetical protein
LLAAAVAAAPALAGCTSSDACLGEIQRAHRDTRTLRARFVQTKHLRLLEAPLVSRGRFILARPDRMLWLVEEPEPATIVVDGGELRVPGLPEAERRALAGAPVAAFTRGLGAMFTGDLGALGRAFEVRAREDGSAIEVDLRPLEPRWQRFFRTAELRFARPDLLPRTLRLRDALDDTLEVELRDLERNVEVSDATFDLRSSR